MRTVWLYTRMWGWQKYCFSIEKDFSLLKWMYNVFIYVRFSGMRNTKTWCKSISTPFVQHHHVVHPCCELRTLCIYATKKNRISAYHYHMSRTVTAKQLLKIILNKMLLWELNNTYTCVHGIFLPFLTQDTFQRHAIFINQMEEWLLLFLVNIDVL